VSPRENAYDRGRRLVQEGRLIVHHVNDRAIEAVCRGDSGQLWRCGYGLHDWHCDRPAPLAKRATSIPGDSREPRALLRV
jgi:hypothetical protein